MLRRTRGAANLLFRDRKSASTREIPKQIGPDRYPCDRRNPWNQMTKCPNALLLTANIIISVHSATLTSMNTTAFQHRWQAAAPFVRDGQNKGREQQSDSPDVALRAKRGRHENIFHFRRVRMRILTLPDL